MRGEKLTVGGSGNNYGDSWDRIFNKRQEVKESPLEKKIESMKDDITLCKIGRVTLEATKTEVGNPCLSLTVWSNDRQYMMHRLYRKGKLFKTLKEMVNTMRGDIYGQ